jgi:superfamily I DNA/RNA helicase
VVSFLIADTFTASLGRLMGEEQKAVKTTAFDLQMDPAGPGMQFHRIDRAKDKSFWSVRVNSDLRLIVHRTKASLLLCYVAHHDDAYRWAKQRRLERHPTTGAAQLVEVIETVREIDIPQYLSAEPSPPAPRKPLFASVPDDELLGYGVPPEWVAVVQEATEDTFFDLADHLPAEAAEALLELATGGTPAPAVQAAPEADPFAHPDAQRRFRILEDAEELARALEFPWDRWTVFLHPAQRELVERDHGGPARVGGSAGTGKTVVALHRAAHLARANPGARVLLATFSDPLARSLEVLLRRLLHNEPRLGENIEVYSTHAVARRLFEANFGKAELVADEDVRRRLESAAAGVEGHRFTSQFLWAEWSTVVDEWQLASWEEYRTVPRLGRKTRLGEAQRATLWRGFETVRESLAAEGLLTRSGLFRRIETHLRSVENPPFDFAVVDEAQDLGVPELRFLAALAAGRPNGLFFAGDLGQRIFQTPFSWLSLGVDVRGRSYTLRINYRTSHQIRVQADRLLPPELSDVDGIVETRRGTLSAFNGPPPSVRVLDTEAEETAVVAQWLKERLRDGVLPGEIGLFVRSQEQIARARAAAATAGLEAVELIRSSTTGEGAVTLGTMHLAKGLEFRAVVVLACDDEVLPLQSRIKSVADDADLQDTYDTERHLLYVACTRAREHLLVTGVAPGSEFLEDMTG